MRIKTFCKLIDNEYLEKHTLKDCSLVIDGQNVLYKLYDQTKLPFIFGCESDKFANYLREYLSRFQNANIKCYIIFKGGHKDISTKFRKNERLKSDFSIDDIFTESYEGKLKPIFMKNVYKEVLEEMGFDYVICELESKKECIAFAQKHNCPILSYDIEFCFSGVPYIPSSSLEFNEDTKTFQCGLFTLDHFLKKTRMTEENLAIFVVLTDQLIFPENHFIDFIKSLRIFLGHYKRNQGLLKWLSNKTRQQALECIFRYTNKNDKAKFLEEESSIKNMIRRKETSGLPTEYLENNCKVTIHENDPLWFEKGIVLRHVDIPYINLYRSGIILGSWAICDNDAENALFLSMDIVKYAYNLFTNFQKEDITLILEKTPVDNEYVQITLASPVQKPNYDANSCVFENGWSGIKSLGLFEHFFTECFDGFKFDRLTDLPEDVRLLIISLVYFSRRKAGDTSNEVYSVLLSYVTLGLEVNNTDNTINVVNKAILDPITDKKMILQSDAQIAREILAEYFADVDVNQVKDIFDPCLLHPLIEFQHCLDHCNMLNKLCGCPYSPTVYSKTYNGTFVYKILYAIKKDGAGDGLVFLKNKLNPAATVLAFLHGLVEAFDEIMYT